MGLSLAFGPESAWPAQDLIALGEEFDTELVLEAYRAGVFPMPLLEYEWLEGSMGWWSPVHRAILPPGDLRVTRSLRQSAKRFRVTFDQAFGEVLRRCADPSRPGRWIDDEVAGVYTEMFAAGVAHSVEAWTLDGRLAGGLYGVSLGGLFAGESMFHEPFGRDASKVALLRLVEFLDADRRDRLLDVQWQTPHLESLGAVEVDRVDYLRMLGDALDIPEPDWGSANA